ncbi:MAG: ABC transporter ATP-binding protein [Thermoplasmata archaeon]|uniref:ABC transporter ATP-binding protein n=1 Tax=Candidatus Sysuiplasma superficiale TaxID=2823368 RepID=A0A8J7YNY7_9ARCH|nr:ABC transporter ATP-binding protein [Candidatus Sysuiplasma superficiale]MBX8644225.1 ABC transporter ATP-binding protein [Candidatus Sysuiplasma superficiale]MCL4347030.1 ABC transporter ATP-binding protein [Candidatus Thermoplasmatota archaeon]MCL5437523.1 ABC transporter ATP-binding protein [Candidatus Thermoplasmatota archaeon]
MSDYSIEVDNLRYAYGGGRYAVDGISFSVSKGEIFGFLGRNGAGKTTTIKVLTTLLKPTSGVAKVLGVNILRGGKALRKRIGVVLQDDSFDFTTVEKAMDIYGAMWGIPREKRRRKIDELLNFFELEEDRKKRLWDLSGGQRRRVQVAREFMHDMELLFLDEPTVGLDTVTRRKILDMVKKKAKGGLTVFFTTHNLEEADYICDRVAIIDHGRILANDTVPMLKKSYSGLKTVEAAFSENPEKVIPLLNSIGNVKIEQPSRTDEPFRITGQETERTLKSVVEIALENGLHLTWLNVHPVTLEEVFLTAVSEGA